LKGIHQMTGDELIAFLASSDSKKGMLVSVILDSTDGPPASKKKGIVYRVNPDNTALADPINDSVGHKHTTAGDGGPLLDVFLEGMKNVWFCRPLALADDYFLCTGPGTFLNKSSGNDQYLELATGTTINNYANIHACNGFYSFGYGIRCSFEVKLTNLLTAYTARFGMNGEPAQSVTDDLGKMIVEACPSCNGNNIRIVSADGTTGSRSNNPKNAANVANVRDKFLLQLTPGTRIDYVSSTGLLQKTLDVPSLSSGNSLPIRNFIAGIQTTDTASHLMEIYQLEAIARKADSSFRNVV